MSASVVAVRRLGTLTAFLERAFLHERARQDTLPDMPGRGRNEEQPETVHIEIEAPGIGAGNGMEPYGQGRALWRSFTVTVDRNPVWPRLELDISVADGKAQIEAVRFQRRPTDPPLSAKSIRVPLAEILQIALTEAVMEVTELSPGHYKIAPLRGDERSAQVRKATVVHTRRQPAGARRLYTDADARKALALYRRAKRNEQKDPFRWVGEQLSRSRSNAYTMVKDAERQEEERRGRSRRKAK